MVKISAEPTISNVEFVAISFDPEVDKPAVLKTYAELRNLDLSNWTFLTGTTENISDLMKEIGILVVPSDTSVVDQKDVIFYVHTDRISLIDQKSQIRKNYLGSSAKIEEIINDIKLIAD